MRIEGEAWTEFANCTDTDPEIFFPPRGSPVSGSITTAKGICSRCPVAVDCLRYALVNEERWGIWGGLTARERVVLRHGGRLRDLKIRKIRKAAS